MTEPAGPMIEDAGREPRLPAPASSVPTASAAAAAQPFVIRTDHVAGAVAIAVALWVLAASTDLPFGTPALPGAGMMPMLLCGLMILFGIVMIARGATSAPVSEIPWRDLPHGLRIFAITAAAVALYTTLGFVVAMSLMLFALTAMERRNLLAAAVYSVGVSLGTYVLFDILLKSPLEQGIFGF